MVKKWRATALSLAGGKNHHEPPLVLTGVPENGKGEETKALERDAIKGGRTVFSNEKAARKKQAPAKEIKQRRTWVRLKKTN